MCLPAAGKACGDVLTGRVAPAVLLVTAAELDYFYNSCNQIATQSALLAGFCYSGMTYLNYVDRDICERTCAEFTYPLTVMCAMCGQACILLARRRVYVQCLLGGSAHQSIGCAHVPFLHFRQGLRHALSLAGNTGINACTWACLAWPGRLDGDGSEPAD